MAQIGGGLPKWLKDLYKKEINNMKRKQKVEVVAKKLCREENRLSTKRLKLELRHDYPSEMWNRLDVSNMFHQLVAEGKFISIADNGTYQTYADVSLPILSIKGDTYIADPPEEGAPTPVTGVKSLAKKLVKAINKSGLKGVKATFVVKRKVPGAKARSVKTPWMPTVVSVTKGTKKTTSKAKSIKAPVKVKAPILPRISRTTALKYILDTKGKFFGCVFVKKDGTERSMNCRLVKDQTVSLGYVKVIDQNISHKSGSNSKSIRNVNLQTLKQLRVSGKTYKVA